MAVIGDRRCTPMPDRETELRAAGSSAVKTYVMSPAELAKYGPAKPYVGPDKKPMVHRRRVNADTSHVLHENREEHNDMGKAPKEAPSCGLTKRIYLEQIAAGETNASIERAWGMKANSLYLWLKQWEVTGVKAEQASKLLLMMPDPANTAPTNGPVAPEKPPAAELPVTISQESDVDWATVTAQIVEEQLVVVQEKDAEIERLTGRMVAAQSEATKAWSEVEQLRVELEEAKAMFDKSYDRNKTANAQIGEHLQSIDGQGKEIKRLQERLEEASGRLAQYEAEKRSVNVQVSGDAVNHPAHYTAGSVECIDAIEAATTGLSGGQAYNTGAAIKYLWRWHFKNGNEDLKKARWHVDRLIKGLG